MKRFLVTNDDGIDSAGIAALVKKLSSCGEVYVAAPSSQQSASSMSITFRREVAVSRTDIEGAREAYIVDASPVDCVMWAVPWFRSLGIEFDYLFSGINLGANVGIAAYYSGTIGAARQGALYGVHSIAMSVGTFESTHFDYICSLIPRIMAMSDSLSAQTMLNVNAPDLPPWDVRGVRIAEAAPYGYAEEYAFDPAGVFKGIASRDITWEQQVQFQMTQRSLDSMPSAGKSSESGPGIMFRPCGTVTDAQLKYDLDCMRYGYAAITPLCSGNSDDIALRKLQGRFSSYEYIAVLIDPQEDNVSNIGMRSIIAGNIGRFAACMRRLDVPVCVTELYGCGQLLPEVFSVEYGGGHSPASGSDSRTASAASPETGRTERVVRSELTAWANSDFARKMQAISASKVLIAGLETHTAVLQTALDFRSRGYDVTIIEDCCAAANGYDHESAIARLRDAGCTVTTTAAAVMELAGTTHHPAAESLRKILCRS